MSTDDDFTAYVGTHWSVLVRAALLLGSEAERAESVVSGALVRSHQRWARVWQDDRADIEVLTRLLEGVYGPAGRVWRGEKAEPGAPLQAEGAVATDDGGGSDPEPPVPDLTRALLPLAALHRDVLVLRYVAELDEIDAADVLAVRPATVQQRLEQALAAVSWPSPRDEPASTERDLMALVEEHRQDQTMSLPPPDLLSDARDVRRGRRRRATAITAGALAGLGLVSGLVHVVRAIGDDAPAAAASVSTPPPWAVNPSGPPATRLVGLNGWAIRVPASWGTDQVACDGVTAAGPTVLFTSLLTRGPDCPTPLPTLYVRIGNERFRGAPWRTVSGVPVLRRPHACAVCATLRVPTAHVSFQIRANSSLELHRIERSLQPISPRQVTVPIGDSTDTARAALDRMVTVATGEGLRPRVLEVPSRRPPGTFLRSDPPIGTPVDLGRSISLFFSAGDLRPYATTVSLRRHGWRIFDVALAGTTYPRTAAVRAALGRGASPAAHPTFLRSLTITHEGPRGVVVRRRLVWLVVTPAVAGPGAASITAVDAATDRVIETQPGFRGQGAAHPG
jgi:hypothetical protein